MRGGACCLAERGSKAHGSKYLPRISLLRNWENEIAKWTGLTFFRYHTNDQKARARLIDTFLEQNKTQHVDILLTTATVLAVKEERRYFFGLKKFDHMIVDEAHFLKSDVAKRVKEMAKIRAGNRILLTGTPVQNNLSELCNLLWFCNPQVFEKLISVDEDSGMLSPSLLQAVSAPFLLRRLKTDVLKDLPVKEVVVFRCELSATQKQAYGSEVEKFQGTNSATTGPRKTSVPQDGLAKLWGGRVPTAGRAADPTLAHVNKNQFRHVFARMRRLCGHPLLTQYKFGPEQYEALTTQLFTWDGEYRKIGRDAAFKKVHTLTDFEVHTLAKKHKWPAPYLATPEELVAGGKVQALLEILDARKNDRTLVFSQYTEYLDVIQAALTVKGFRFLRLDGSVGGDDRQALVEAFGGDGTAPKIIGRPGASAKVAAEHAAKVMSAEIDVSKENLRPYQVFLLSTKAGGLGLNLVMADMAVLMDMSYNPMDNRQAEDRVHRIGQNRDVSIVYMLMNDTIEQRVLDINLRKIQLDAQFGGASAGLAAAEGANAEEGRAGKNGTGIGRAGAAAASSSARDESTVLGTNSTSASRVPRPPAPPQKSPSQSDDSSVGSSAVPGRSNAGRLSSGEDDPLSGKILTEQQDKDFEKQAMNELKNALATDPFCNGGTSSSAKEEQEKKQEESVRGLVRFARTAADLARTPGGKRRSMSGGGPPGGGVEEGPMGGEAMERGDFLLESLEGKNYRGEDPANTAGSS